jgi:CSLREA domain-containing protein
MSIAHSFSQHFLLRPWMLPVLGLTGLLFATLLVSGALAASYTVNTVADNTTSGDGFCTLREAVHSANNAGNGDCGPNSNADDLITFSLPGTITLSLSAQYLECSGCGRAAH